MVRIDYHNKNKRIENLIRAATDGCHVGCFLHKVPKFWGGASLRPRLYSAPQIVTHSTSAEQMPFSDSHKDTIWVNAELHRQDGVRSKRASWMALLQCNFQ